MIVKNLANFISFLGVLAIGVLFLDGGYQYILPLIVFNNVMDDLDGVVAGKLDIRSEFGATLDNVCDAVVHTVLVLMVGIHYGWVSGVFALAASTAILIRIVSRMAPGAIPGVGSPTNELIRHMFFVLLLAKSFGFDATLALIAVFTLHTVSMLLPYRLPALLRSLTKSATSIAMVNVALIAAWLVPYAAPVVALAFGSTYLYALVSGSIKSSKAAPLSA